MKIIVFKGGLGNQMFQYVFYTWLKSKYNDKIYGFYGRKELRGHNGFELSNVFPGLELPKESFLLNLLVYYFKFQNKLTNRKNHEKSFYNTFSKEIIFDDYWQDLKYFQKRTTDFFIFTDNIGDRNEELLEYFKKNEIVSLHVRRGDYLNLPDLYGNACDREYYKKAIGYIENKIESPVFAVFSDDMDWVKENLQLSNALYVDWNRGKNAHIDMYLMSKCKHNIIANSTFSWWGAYLNDNTNKIVICPQRWFNDATQNPDIIQDNWIRI